MKNTNCPARKGDEDPRRVTRLAVTFFRAVMRKGESAARGGRTYSLFGNLWGCANSVRRGFG